MPRNIAIITLVNLLILAAINIGHADDIIDITVPDISSGYVYSVNPDKHEYAERFDRVYLYLNSFDVPSELSFIDVIRQRDKNFAVILGDHRWSYGYSEVSGMEFFVDLARYQRELSDESLELIDENRAADIALDFVKGMFFDDSQ